MKNSHCTESKEKKKKSGVYIFQQNLHIIYYFQAQHNVGNNLE